MSAAGVVELTAREATAAVVHTNRTAPPDDVLRYGKDVIARFR